MIPLKTQAIQTALLGDWSTAISLNLELLKKDPDDIDTLNRLAFAYTVIGNIKDAKDTYHRVIRIDPQNPIAQKNLKRLSGLSGTKVTNGEEKGNGMAMPQTKLIMHSMFVEETGKTKVIELMNIADAKVIAPLRTGEYLTLQIKRSKIFVLDSQKQYIGMLPQDLGGRLITFMEGGNEYEVYSKSVDKKRITVFIKETKRANKFKNQPSFTSLTKGKMHLENHPKAQRSTKTSSSEETEAEEE